jgi:hypothetical protein
MSIDGRLTTEPEIGITYANPSPSVQSMPTQSRLNSGPETGMAEPTPPAYGMSTQGRPTTELESSSVKANPSSAQRPKRRLSSDVETVERAKRVAREGIERIKAENAARKAAAAAVTAAAQAAALAKASGQNPLPRPRANPAISAAQKEVPPAAVSKPISQSTQPSPATPPTSANLSSESTPVQPTVDQNLEEKKLAIEAQKLELRRLEIEAERERILSAAKIESDRIDKEYKLRSNEQKLRENELRVEKDRIRTTNLERTNASLRADRERAEREKMRQHELEKQKVELTTQSDHAIKQAAIDADTVRRRDEANERHQSEVLKAEERVAKIKAEADASRDLALTTQATPAVVVVAPPVQPIIHVTNVSNVSNVSNVTNTANIVVTADQTDVSRTRGRFPYQPVSILDNMVATLAIEDVRLVRRIPSQPSGRAFEVQSIDQAVRGLRPLGSPYQMPQGSPVAMGRITSAEHESDSEHSETDAQEDLTEESKIS